MNISKQRDVVTPVFSLISILATIRKIKRTKPELILLGSVVNAEVRNQQAISKLVRDGLKRLSKNTIPAADNKVQGTAVMQILSRSRALSGSENIDNPARSRTRISATLEERAL